MVGFSLRSKLGVRAEIPPVSGADDRSFEAPILEFPPAYRTSFCSRCGSPVPDPRPGEDWFEIPAGLLDDDPLLRPDKHIFVDRKSPWFEIHDTLPQLTRLGLYRLRLRALKKEE